MVNIKFRIESDLQKEYEWTLHIFGKYIGFDCVFVNEGEDILIAEHGMGEIQVSHFFKNLYVNKDYQFKSYFRKEPLHYSASNKPDYLSTCFYLLSYLQEYSDYVPDKYDRFPYDLSFQKHFHCVEENLVSAYFDFLYDSIPKLKSLVSKQIHQTKFFLTHDIDSAYGALGDNFSYLLKQGKIGMLLQLIMNHFLKTPDYLLLDKIMDIEEAADVKSTFFWLVNYGMGNKEIRNADYQIQEKRIKKAKHQVYHRKFSNGLHKSVNGNSYAEELKKLDQYGVAANRNHYLRIELPNGFDAMEKGEIQLDTTMGFPEVFGMRNNYGLPIHPYHVKEKRAYSFLEVPLHIMDTTLKHYQKKNAAQSQKDIFNFLEKQKQNAIITILWHNNYFFDYTDTGWLALYKSIIEYIKEQSFGFVTPEDLIKGAY